jgi:hypothetical protein
MKGRGRVYQSIDENLLVEKVLLMKSMNKSPAWLLIIITNLHN